MNNTVNKPKLASFSALDLSLYRIGFTLSPVASADKDWHVMRGKRTTGVIVAFPMPTVVEVWPRGQERARFTDLNAVIEEITYLTSLE